jgi:hypothetical protein
MANEIDKLHETRGAAFAGQKMWDSLSLEDRKKIVAHSSIQSESVLPLKAWAKLSKDERDTLYRLDWMAILHPKSCNRCSASVVHYRGVSAFCHESGCPNEKKEWVAERGEWVRFVDCHICGCAVEVGEYCGCCEETGGEPDETYQPDEAFIPGDDSEETEQA